MSDVTELASQVVIGKLENIVKGLAVNSNREYSPDKTLRETFEGKNPDALEIRILLIAEELYRRELRCALEIELPEELDVGIETMPFGEWLAAYGEFVESIESSAEEDYEE